MKPTWMNSALLGQDSRVSDLGQNFQDPTQTSMALLGWLAFAALLLGIACVTSWWLRRYLGKRETSMEHQRWRLFQELCSVHDLKRADFLNLKRLAKVLRLDNPAVLFVKPDCFEVSRPTRHFSSQVWQELMGIRDRLFARRLERKALHKNQSPNVEKEI